MTKRFLIILVALLWLTDALALTQQQFIDEFLKGKKLELIEGVWIYNDGGRIEGIHKDGDQYFIRMINTSNPRFSSGQFMGKLYKSSQSSYSGNYKQDIKWGFKWEIENANVRYSVTNNSLYKDQSDSAGSISMTLRRLWPSDISSHNAKIDKKKEKPKKKQPKKKQPKKKQPKYDDNKVVAAASGTGFFVSKSGHVVTNHHVIDQCKAVKVNFKGDEIEAKTLAIDKTNDLAIIKTNINPEKAYAISNEDVSLLEDVIVAGFPLGKKVSTAIKTHKGNVTALVGYADNSSNFQTDATINQGNSGGPIINQKGNVVGIAVQTWVEKGVQSIHFGIKSSTLKTFGKINSITFLPPNNQELTNKELGQLITEGTVYLECFMTIAKIKKMIAETNKKKAFYTEHQ